MSEMELRIIMRRAKTTRYQFEAILVGSSARGFGDDVASAIADLWTAQSADQQLREFESDAEASTT